MKKSSSLKKLFAALLAVVMIAALVPTAALAADANSVDIDFLCTSDVHGQLYATDYTADAAKSGAYTKGLTHVATFVKQQRAAYKNVFLADAGDLSQGTPLTYYYDFNQPNVDDPAMKTLRTMGYNMFVLGNHEFNYGMTILQRQLKYLTSAASGSENPVNVCVANYLDAKTNSDKTKDWATWNGYKPYQVYDYEGVKVAVIGLGNPDIANWDAQTNWNGIYFAGAEETYKHYEAEMQANSDIIVVVAHFGLKSEFGNAASDCVAQLVKDTNSIDLVFSGHEHGTAVTAAKNKDGNTVNIIQPGTKAALVGQAVVTYDKTAGKITKVDAKNVAMDTRNADKSYTANYAVDSNLEAVLKPYETATWKDYMLTPIGTASGNYSAANLGTAPSAFMDLINTVQLWGAYDNTGKNTPSNKADDTMAQLSISAPLIVGTAANVIPQGNITLGDLFKLYRFENWFYQVKMSGKELHQWLEFAATKIKTDANGNPTVATGDILYYDVIMGKGFSYVLDPAQPEGSRVVSMTYNGKAVADTDTFTVVMNNYRFTGGGKYIEWLNAHGCDMSDLSSRVVYYTRDNMIQGEDLGQARNLLGAYIQAKKTITPTITSTWSLKNSTPFTDVKVTDYFYGPVAALTKSGTIGGMTKTTFVPAGTLTRGQMIALLYSIAGKPAVTDKAKFADVASGSYYENAISWAVANKITAGTSATTFAPGAPVTREQAVTFLYVLAQMQKKDVSKTKDLTAYTDYASLSGYARDAMSWAVGSGLVSGTSATTLGPSRTATRGQAAVILYQFSK
jgi:2',3'-cyclic-nucleotide 2'-phosphodiesterase/3'-nucleotidase/5'-nucleotidase